MAGGRPTKYRQEYCQRMIDYMAQGFSYTAFAAEIDVNVDTLNEWVKRHEKFSVAKKRAFAKNLQFWEKMGIDGALGKKKNFNVTAWIFNMKNRHMWRDRVESTTTHVVSGYEFVEDDEEEESSD